MEICPSPKDVRDIIRSSSWRFAPDDVPHILWCYWGGVVGDSGRLDLWEPVQLGTVDVDSLGVGSLIVGVGILLGEGQTCLLFVKSAIASSFGKLEEVFAIGGLLLEGGGLLLLLLVLSDEE